MAQTPRAGEWPAYAGNAASTKYSTLDQIDRDNLQRLKIAWRWSSPDNDDKRRHPTLHFNLFECTPLMIDGVLYAATNLNLIVAIDPITGKTVWTYDPGMFDPAAPDFAQPYANGFIDCGVAACGDSSGRRIFVGTVNAYLVALDAATGRPATGFGENGRVDPVQGLGREFPRRFYGVTSPPIIVGDAAPTGSGRELRADPHAFPVALELPPPRLAVAGLGGLATHRPLLSRSL